MGALPCQNCNFRFRSAPLRYARNKNGVRIALPDGLIDLEKIRDVMEGVAGFFDGADGLLSDYASAAL